MSPIWSRAKFRLWHPFRPDDPSRWSGHHTEPVKAAFYLIFIQDDPSVSYSNPIELDVQCSVIITSCLDKSIMARSGAAP